MSDDGIRVIDSDGSGDDNSSDDGEISSIVRRGDYRVPGFMNPVPTTESRPFPPPLPECRICLQPDRIVELITPCNCIGTSRYVHAECLYEWRRRYPVGHVNRESCNQCCRRYGIPLRHHLPVVIPTSFLPDPCKLWFVCGWVFVNIAASMIVYFSMIETYLNFSKDRDERQITRRRYAQYGVVGSNVLTYNYYHMCTIYFRMYNLKQLVFITIAIIALAIVLSDYDSTGIAVLVLNTMVGVNTVVQAMFRGQRLNNI